MRPDGLIDGVVYEVDGWSAHGTPSAFVEDRRRLRALVAELGLDFLAFTPADLQHGLERCVDDIEQTVRRRRARGLGGPAAG